MRMLLLGTCLTILAAGFTACGSKAPGDPTVVAGGLPGPSFTDEESKRIEALRSAEGLALGLINSPSGFQTNPDGTMVGLNYEIGKAFAKFLGVSLKVVGLQISDYFSRDGKLSPEVKTDPKIAYTPDVFRRVQVLGGNIARLPWREKLMNLLSLYPTRLVVVGRKDLKLETPQDLKGLRLGTIPFTTYEKALTALSAEVTPAPKPVEVEKENQFFELVAAKKADGFLLNTLEIFLVLRNWPDLAVGFPVGEESEICWGFAKEDPVLAKLFEEFLQKIRTDGTLDRIFLRTMSITYKDYLDLIQGREAPKP